MHLESIVGGVNIHNTDEEVRAMSNEFELFEMVMAVGSTELYEHNEH